ncbi:hypothetical protein [Streptomyces sp. NPDC048111]|uniref:hypothetical protein n=1 Tax=Streptomyces sp. NPDC048111 TaxID=3365500 RepID=UPI003719BA2C
MSALGVLMVDLAALDAADVTRPRPGPVDPGSCAVCAVVKALAAETVELADPGLAADWAELAHLHAVLGHPEDTRRHP